MIGGGHFTIFTWLTGEILPLYRRGNRPLHLSACQRTKPMYGRYWCQPPALLLFLQIRLFPPYLALDECFPGDVSEINFIWSLITEHALRCIPHASLNCRPPPPPPCHFQSYFKAVRDYLWHCLTRAWRLSLFLLSLLSPSVFLPFLSNQKAKPGRRLRANNKSLLADVWRCQSDRGGETCWWLRVLKPTPFYSFCLFFFRFKLCSFWFWSTWTAWSL